MLGELGDKAAPPPGFVVPEPGAERLDYLADLPQGDAQRSSLCARNHQDRFSEWYCGAGQPAVGDLASIVSALGLTPARTGTQSNFALTGHSSSLVARETTVLNPRAILFTPPGTADFTSLGFVRGGGLVEVAAFDTVAQELHFYLVSYDLPCEPNCENADKYLPGNESGWTDVSVYEAADLKNTAVDCLQCHQPGGANAERILRMQELEDPWTHWFRPTRGSRVLLDTFLAAHPGESYATIPSALIDDSDPQDLEDFVRDAGFSNQPNAFDGRAVNNDDPAVTTPNATWLGLYAAAVAGSAISPPYFAISPYDAGKVATASDAYRQVVAGAEPASALPDLHHLFREDAAAHLGFTAAPNLSAQQIVAHRCGTCHDGSFPGISRNAFVVGDFPNNLSADMKARVLERITLPRTSVKRMPPAIFSDLTEEQKDLIRAAL